jgi:hypothetical protein
MISQSQVWRLPVSEKSDALPPGYLHGRAWQQFYALVRFRAPGSKFGMRS